MFKFVMVKFNNKLAILYYMDLEGKIKNCKPSSWNKFKLKAAELLFASLPFLGCGGGGGGGTGTEIPQTTKVLDDPSEQRFLTDTTGTLTFLESTDQLNSLSVGDIYIADVNPVTPNGFLREVTNTYPASGNIIVETIPTTLENAIKRGSTSTNRTLTPGDIQVKALKAGVLQPLGSPSFSLLINNVVLYDADGNGATISDQIIANGNVSFDVNYNFSMNIDNFKLKQLNFTNNANINAQLKLDSYASILDVNKKVEIAKYTFSPTTIFIGYVPVVVIPTLSVNVGLNGKVSVNVSTDVTNQATASAEISYNDGVWNNTKTFSNNFQFNSPTFSTNSKIKAYAGPTLSLLLYGVLGPYGEINGYSEFENGINTNPWWILYGGLEGKLGAEFGILSYSITNYNITVFDYKKILAQSGTPGEGSILFTSTSDGDEEIYMMNPDGSNIIQLTNNTVPDTNAGWFPNGTEIVFVSYRDGNNEIYKMNKDGTGQTRLTNNTFIDFYPSVSSDGMEIVFVSSRDGNYEIYKMNKDGTGQTRLTNNAANDYSPIFSLDNTEIIFESNRDGSYGLYKMNKDGTGQVKFLQNAAYNNRFPTISPSGTEIAFVSNRDGNDEIYRINKDLTGLTRLTFIGPSEDWTPSWSPDGDKIVFASYRDSNFEVYKMNRDGSSQIRLTNNTAFDTDPAWSPSK